MNRSSLSITTTNVDGIHARPASIISRLVMDSGCNVTIRYGDQTADGGSVLELLMLSIPQHALIHIEATGERAPLLIKELESKFACNFDLP